MTHRIGAKGQVVIPKGLRDRLGLRPGSRVVFEEDGEAIRLIPVGDVRDLGGLYKGSGMAERLLEDRRAEPR